MKHIWHHLERFLRDLFLSSSGGYVFSATCLAPSQSQRDCVLQPRVARNELPWVGGPLKLNPERVPPKTLNRYSPSGSGSILCSAFDNPSCSELLQCGPWFSLSLRERAGVRGNGPRKLKTASVLQLPHELRIKPATHLVQLAFGSSAFFRPSVFGF